jgi:hypothetical protein
VAFVYDFAQAAKHCKSCCFQLQYEDSALRNISNPVSINLMKRDLELMRSIILEIEASNTTISDNDRSDDWMYNAKLLIESGFVKGSILKTVPPGNTQIPSSVILREITPEGHDFLDATRNPEAWEKTKSRMQQVGSWTLKLVLELATDYTKKLLIP